jgi:hypothetical protein
MFVVDERWAAKTKPRSQRNHENGKDRRHLGSGDGNILKLTTGTHEQRRRKYGE